MATSAVKGVSFRGLKGCHGCSGCQVILNVRIQGCSGANKDLISGKDFLRNRMPRVWPVFCRAVILFMDVLKKWISRNG